MCFVRFSSKQRSLKHGNEETVYFLWGFELSIYLFIYVLSYLLGGGAVGWGTAPQAGRSRVRFTMRLLGFLLPNPSGRTKAMESTQPVTQMSTWG